MSDTIVLAELSVPSRTALDLKYVDRWNCPACDEWHDGEEPESENYYDLSDIIYQAQQRIDNGDGPIKVGELEQWGKRVVDEVETVVCPRGNLVDASDISHEKGWQCPECSEVWEEPHSAAECCENCMTDTTDPDDNCLRFVSVSETDVDDGWAYCRCSEDCMKTICLYCHVWYDSGDAARTHIEADHRLYDEEVNVGRPASLPPAYEYVQEPEVVPPVAGCAMCASEFCCKTHGVHKTPHRGHAG